MYRTSQALSAVAPQTDRMSKLRRELTDIASYFGVYHVDERIRWEVLSEDDRRALDDDYTTKQLVEYFARFRGTSLERAIVELALEASVIDVGRHRRLLRQLGELAEDEAPRPRWDREAGRLFYRGDSIRSVSARGTNIRPILDAFQEEGWPARINNPLPGGEDSKKLRETLDSLREGLSGIDFFADGTAAGILWQAKT